ncbi:STAS domain-containing protein [Salicola sp. Rm-C-2C1-2]|uniref:STAS domain-containing protein n=1 Tax=Salicola sp. Rm-C-2C1-2 TaxID=3141321 RepID=UPI0032E3975C
MNDTSREGVIALGERFDFGIHQTFIAESQQCLEDTSVRTLVVNLARTQFIDSAALGMLIQLKKKCDNANKSLVISNAKGSVKDTLEIANIQKMITMR